MSHAAFSIDAEHLFLSQSSLRLRSRRIPAKSTPPPSKFMPQELVSRWLDTTIAHTGSAETNDTNFTVVAQAEALRHSRLFKPLKMTPTTFTVTTHP
jgi:hypothetical protein